MITQLNPYIPLITPAGYAEAFAMSDPSPDHFPLFYCFMENRIVCVFQSIDVRQIQNITYERSNIQVEKLFTEEQIKRWEWAKIVDDTVKT
jgi:hypothetical protein